MLKPFVHLSARLFGVILAAFSLTACTGGDEQVASALTITAPPPPGADRVKTTRHLKYGDYDPVKIKGRQPADFAIHGIDLSRHNKRIDWRRVKKEGIAFAFLKATEGKDDSDPRFGEFWRATKAAGIPRSAYHFYYFCASPQAQAANYIRNVPKTQQSLPPVLDVEWNPESPTCKTRPSPRKVRADLKKWLTIIERHYRQKPIIYTTVDFHHENFAGGHLPGYQYWLRSVTAEPKYKYGDAKWTFWQYTGTGKVPGIEGPVDLNAWRGSRAAWKQWLGKNTRR